MSKYGGKACDAASVADGSKVNLSREDRRPPEPRSGLQVRQLPGRAGDVVHLFTDNVVPLLPAMTISRAVPTWKSTARSSRAKPSGARNDGRANVQWPSTNDQTNSKSQCPKHQKLGIREVGIWFIDACYLFEIWSLRFWI